MKRKILYILIGIIIGYGISVVADTINSNEVLYDNTLSTSSATDVKGAIDDLYDKIVHSNGAYNLIGHIDDTLSTDLIAGLYRYQGTNVNNYLCFGTTDKSTCTEDVDKYMYRIIGFGLNGQMKLIKSTNLSTGYSWKSPLNCSVTWVNSSLYAGLNDNYFLNNTSYVPNEWRERIVSTDWKYGVVTNGNTTVDNIVNVELAFNNSVNAKIGLMYLHDYYYGLPGNRNCGDQNNRCKTNWIYNNAYQPSTYEWLITRSSGCNAWTIWDGFARGDRSVEYAESIRPVFFLNSTETIASGSGTLTDPYILN